jgi:hypothetical protein
LLKLNGPDFAAKERYLKPFRGFSKFQGPLTRPKKNIKKVKENYPFSEQKNQHFPSK